MGLCNFFFIQVQFPAKCFTLQKQGQGLTGVSVSLKTQISVWGTGNREQGQGTTGMHTYIPVVVYVHSSHYRSRGAGEQGQGAGGDPPCPIAPRYRGLRIVERDPLSRAVRKTPKSWTGAGKR